MKYEDVLRVLAPCGLDCGRCADFESGEISRLSSKLKDLLAGYARVAEMKAESAPMFEGYANFEEILDSFAQAPCGGCRSDHVRCPIDCNARTCHKHKGVDFCFQCKDYPCENPTFGPLIPRWKARNDRMKEVGVPAFYQEQFILPRYWPS